MALEKRRGAKAGHSLLFCLSAATTGSTIAALNLFGSQSAFTAAPRSGSAQPVIPHHVEGVRAQSLFQPLGTSTLATVVAGCVIGYAQRRQTIRHAQATSEPSVRFSFRFDQSSGRASFASDGNHVVQLGTVVKGGPSRYLMVPERILKAAWPADTMAPVQVEGLGRYVLPLPAIELLALRWQAKVGLRTSFSEQARALRIYSDGVDLGLAGNSPGDAAFKNAFEMAVRGVAADVSEGSKGLLKLDVHMEVRGKIPGPLAMFTPENMLEDAAREVSRLTIGFVMNTVCKRLCEDYRAWEEEQSDAKAGKVLMASRAKKA